MSTAQIVLLAIGALLGLGVVAYAVFVVRTLANTRKPIPIDTGGPARSLASDLPLTGDSPAPAMDIYGPARDAAGAGGAARPLILFVPGDGPEMMLKNAKRWQMFISYAELCASRGYVAAIMNHRSSGNFKRTEPMVLDISHALETLRQRADELGLDPERIVVWTFSGSAGPVLSHLLRHPVAGLRGLISFYGMLDLSTYLIKVAPPVVERYSLPRVLPQLERLACPLYLLNVGRDSKMISRGFDNTERAISGRELPITTRVYAGGRHGFEVLCPPEEVEAEIERAFEFIGGCLDSREQQQGQDVALSA